MGKRERNRLLQGLNNSSSYMDKLVYVNLLEKELKNNERLERILRRK